MMPPRANVSAARLVDNCRLYRVAGGLLLCLSNAAALAQPKPILIQPEIQYQRLDGFGITTGNGVAKELMVLPAAERTKLLDLLFGPEGARFNIIRAEVSWAAKRLPLTHPLYLRGFMYYFADEEEETAQFNLFREAQKRGEIYWSSCVWSPPPPWKTSQSQHGGELLAKHYEDFATYLAAYVEFYRNLRYQKVDVLSLQNEPNQAKATPSCVLKTGELKALLKAVGKRFAERGITTKLMLPDVGWDQLADYLRPIVDDPEARGLVSHLSAHSTDTESPGRAFAKELSKRQNLRLWQTEYALPDDDRFIGIEGGLRLAGSIWSDLLQAECQAWLYWAPVPPSGWSGRLGLFDKSGPTWKATKRFWSLSQFSRFLPRNSVRISASGGSSAVIAFRNPQYNGIVVILLNPSRQAVTETLETRGWNLERMIAYRTSETEDCQPFPLPAESGSKSSIHLEPASITTLVAQIRRLR